MIVGSGMPGGFIFQWQALQEKFLERSLQDFLLEETSNKTLKEVLDELLNESMSFFW